jgi:hypothetical protein
MVYTKGEKKMKNNYGETGKSGLIYGLWSREYAIRKRYIDIRGFLTFRGLDELRRRGR